AEALGVSQPTLSAAVRKLEDELGVPLFDRTGRGVELTETGRVFVEHARGVLRDLESGKRAVRALAGLEAGTIRVGGGATAEGDAGGAGAREACGAGAGGAGDGDDPGRGRGDGDGVSAAAGGAGGAEGAPGAAVLCARGGE